MYKKSLAIAIFLLLAASVSQAAVVACSTLTGQSYLAILTQTGVGQPSCYNNTVGVFDMLFYFAPITVSGTSTTAAAIEASTNVNFGTPSSLPGTLPAVSSINLSPNSSGAVPLWTNAGLGGGNPSFTFAINAVICSVAGCAQPTDVINTVNLQQGGTIPDASNTSTSLLTAGGTQILTTNATTTANETTQANTNTQFANSLTSVNLPSGSTLGITNFTYQYTEVLPSTVPEPTTMLLMGGALVGLGLVSRKRRNKKV